MPPAKVNSWASPCPTTKLLTLHYGTRTLLVPTQIAHALKRLSSMWQNYKNLGYTNLLFQYTTLVAFNLLFMPFASLSMYYTFSYIWHFLAYLHVIFSYFISCNLCNNINDRTCIYYFYELSCAYTTWHFDFYFINEHINIHAFIYLYQIINYHLHMHF